jgi:hypothetical protein
MLLEPHRVIAVVVDQGVEVGDLVEAVTSGRRSANGGVFEEPLEVTYFTW